MPYHIHYENTWYRMNLNATLQRLRFLLHHINTMSRPNNYTTILLSMNITDEDIDYAKNFLGNLTNYKTSNDQIGCYCNGTVRDLALEYKNYHGYAALIVCLFGTLANMLNIVVLTRKDMVTAPINRILTGLATADMLVMLEYIPFAIYMYIVLPKRQIFPYGWAVFVLFHMHFTQLLHTISIAITLTLAVWRYIAIRCLVPVEGLSLDAGRIGMLLLLSYYFNGYGMQNVIILALYSETPVTIIRKRIIRFPQYNSWCTAARCKTALWSSFLAPFVACAPSYLVFGIRRQAVNENGTLEIAYTVDADYSQHKDFFYQLNFWVLGVVVKLLPCVILTVISCWLIKALYRAKGRKQALKSYNQCKNAGTMGNGSVPRRPSKSEKRADRTTKMLVAVLLLFLVTEIPQGILGLLSGVLGDCFFRNCYHNFGEVMDILALLNGAINFILYCSMSRQFRTTFGHLFKPRIMKKWQPATQQTDVQSTYV